MDTVKIDLISAERIFGQVELVGWFVDQNDQRAVNNMDMVLCIDIQRLLWFCLVFQLEDNVPAK